MTDRQERDDRRAAALRENLRRRKAQARETAADRREATMPDDKTA